MEKKINQKHNLFLKLKKSVRSKLLKNGEIVLIDTECGKWAKTSVSFIPIMKELKKGLSKDLMEKKIKKRYKDKAGEILSVLDVIAINDLLEPSGKQNQVKTIDIYKLSKVRVLVNPTVKTDVLLPLIIQLQTSRTNDQIELIFDFEKEKINFSKIMYTFNQIKTNFSSIIFAIRLDFNDLLNEEIDLLIKDKKIKFQINYNFDSDTFEDNEKKVLQMQKLNENSNSVELRYPIVEFYNSKKKKQLILDFLNLPFNSYYFTWDEIAKKDFIRDKRKYYNNLLPALDYFIEETRIISKEGYLKNIYIENSIMSSILFPVKRNSCSAGINNFYINQFGEVFPCKYSQEKKLSNFSKNDASSIWLKCNTCIYKNYCGGLCNGIQQESIFNKLCKIQKKTLDQCFSLLGVDLLKKVEEAEKNSNSISSESEVTTTDIELMQEQLIRRQTCLIGLY